MIPGYGAGEALVSELSGEQPAIFSRFYFEIHPGKRNTLYKRRSDLQRRLDTQEKDQSRLKRDIFAAESRNAFDLIWILYCISCI